MCASYGLGGFLKPGEKDPNPFGLPPLDERDNQLRLREWMNERDGRAKITGRNARNFNPLIRVVDSERQLDFAWWWLHVGGAPAEYSAFNARDDKLTRAWIASFKHRRAILPATWYVEKGVTFRLPDDGLFGMAAIYSEFDDIDGTTRVSYALVTRDAVAEAKKIHPRMPLILPRDVHDSWLDPERSGDQELIDEMKFASEGVSESVKALKPPEPATLF